MADGPSVKISWKVLTLAKIRKTVITILLRFTLKLKATVEQLLYLHSLDRAQDMSSAWHDMYEQKRTCPSAQMGTEFESNHVLTHANA